jgi:hypothetical protein
MEPGHIAHTTIIHRALAHRSMPPGTPFERHQSHTRMLEHGMIPWWTARAAELT